MKTISEYQAEHKIWEVKNFGEQQPHTCHLGLIEETGELAHGVLKQQQKIRGTKEQHDVAIKDAIGDIIIYLMGYCTSRSIELQDCFMGGAATFSEVQTIANVEKMLGPDHYVRDVSKSLNGVWSKNEWEIEGLVYSLARICILKEWQLQEVFEHTWTKVVQRRDWVADPVAGGQA